MAHIRRARPGDAAAIARMANALNRQEGLSPRAFTPAIVRRDAFGRCRSFRVLVAETGGRVVGYNTDIAARALWMFDLYVLPSRRSREIGRTLVAAVAREAVRRAVPCIEGGVRGRNTRARRFYRGLGARVANVRSASLQGSALVALAGLPGH